MELITNGINYDNKIPSLFQFNKEKIVSVKCDHVLWIRIILRFIQRDTYFLID